MDYWNQSVVSPVLFKQAVSVACENHSFDLVLEIGPHTALKMPALQQSGRAWEEICLTLVSLNETKVPWSLLQKDSDGMESFRIR